MSLYAPSFTNCQFPKIYLCFSAGCSNLHIVWNSLFSFVVFEANVLTYGSIRTFLKIVFCFFS
ncbi:hypothetical protein CW304_30590 [Bacillus sp. UFRGS-B20]|nr:hypothetical protein CW304_30590 [Bacillus sp. UFRGS-B20]